MFNPVHHYCHPFTDFYKGLTCVELRPFLTVRKSDTFILWRACLLVVPAGLNPRTYSIGTLHFHLNPKYIFGCKNTGFGIPFFVVFCFSYYVFREFFFQRGVVFGRSTSFFLSLFMCFGIARNFLTIFLTYSSSECVVFFV